MRRLAPAIVALTGCLSAGDETFVDFCDCPMFEEAVSDIDLFGTGAAFELVDSFEEDGDVVGANLSGPRPADPEAAVAALADRLADAGFSLEERSGWLLATRAELSVGMRVEERGAALVIRVPAARDVISTDEQAAAIARELVPVLTP